MIELSKADARRMAIAAQRLAGPRPKPTRAGILRLIRDMSYLQLDPTNVVARNPYQVLFSRIGAYDMRLLDDLVAKRQLFETPSLILPMSEFAVHGATMAAYKRATDPSGRETAYRKGDNAGGGTWAKYARRWLTKNAHTRRAALARLRREGTLALTDFEDRAVVSWTSGGWNNERNTTMLLAILQRRGEIAVVGRRRGQKLYGLANGHWPKVRLFSGTGLAREAARRALEILQVATLRQLVRQYAYGRLVTQEALDALERAGEIERVQIEGVASRQPYYALAGIERRARAVRERWEPRTTLLSPFDPLIIDRDRTLALFGFFYRMEIYVPPAKRVRGYWAMPVLHGDEIVGSVDPRVDRPKGELIVNRVVLEKTAPRSAMPAIRRAVRELAEWTGATKVRWPD